MKLIVTPENTKSETFDTKVLDTQVPSCNIIGEGGNLLSFASANDNTSCVIRSDNELSDNIEDIEIDEIEGKKTEAGPWRNRSFVFTLWDHTFEGGFDNFDWNGFRKKLDELGTIRYMHIGDELTKKTKKRHGQSFFVYNGSARESSTALKLLQKLFPQDGIYCRSCRKCDLANERYTSKDAKNLFRYGEPPKQGERNDIKSVVDNILSKKVSLKTLRKEEPQVYNQFQRTFKALETDVYNDNYRTEMTKGIWYYGGTGTGKTTLAIGDKDIKDIYFHNTEDKGWWDNYKQQDYVIIDDFRGEINYNELLKIIDKHPNYSVSRRGQSPMNFTSKEVIITSSLHPSEVYHRRHDKDNIAQLMRRVEVIFLGGRDEYVDYLNEI